MQEQRYSAKNSYKDFMVNHNKCDLRRPGIEPRLPDSKPNDLPFEPA
jgi:hypothetical protein